MTVDIAAGEEISIGSDLSVTLLQKSGRKARLRIVAPRGVRIEKTQSPAANCSAKPSMVM